MSDQQYPPDDHAHWGLSTASIDEMPPEDFEVDYTDGFDFSLKNLGLPHRGDPPDLLARRFQSSSVHAATSL